MIKLNASEHSRRANDTRPGVSMILQDNRLQAEALTLQQRVELPIWHPEGMRGLHEDPQARSARSVQRHRSVNEEDEEETSDEHDEIEAAADNPRPQDFLPHIMPHFCQNIHHVLQTL